jgi:hypothetical protein
MTHVEMHEWLDYLRDCKVIDHGQWLNLRTMLDHRLTSVHTKAMVFASRMRDTHPELWVPFKAKRRILGLSSSNPSHIHQHL